MTAQQVSVKNLKRWAQRELPATSPLRRVLAAEDDLVPVSDFISRLGLYMRLAEERQGEENWQ
jgi:hypothetical protein